MRLSLKRCSDREVIRSRRVTVSDWSAISGTLKLSKAEERLYLNTVRVQLHLLQRAFLSTAKSSGPFLSYVFSGCQGTLG